MKRISGFLANIKDLQHLKRAGKVIVAIWLMALIAEITIFILAPNEMMGWGEKPSLRPDPLFGWRLIESKTTRLRWQGYDYVVTSNSLGFPGPKYAANKPPSVYRIMTVGSAFTSAEGVNTARAWPRVLELILNQRGVDQTVEVMNFAVTGYGPSQYAAVMEEFAPVYRPDAIIVTLIPNDLKKVMAPFSKRVKGIGFDRPNPNGVFAILTCQHFLRSTKSYARRIFYESIKHRPDPLGYFLGQIWAFERDRHHFFEESRPALEEHLTTLRTVADRMGSRLILLLVPASIQVCSPKQLRYFPKPLELSDSTRFNLDQPQHWLAGSAVRLGIEHYDLRDEFNLTPDQCFYHPNNMHWTEEGHQVVAEFIAGRLAITTEDGNPE